MRIRILGSLAGCGLALALAFQASPAAAQTDQWNALYDRIIRLEHEIKSMQGGQVAGQQPAGDANFRLTQLEDRMRQLMSQMQELSYQVREMQQQMQALGARRQGTHQPPLEEAPQQQAFEQQPQAEQQAEAPPQPDYSLERSNEPLDYSQYQSPQPYQPQEFTAESSNSAASDQGQQQLAPGPTNLGQLRIDQQGGMEQATASQEGVQQSLLPEKVETASLDGTEITGEAGADAGYQRAYDSLLGRRFGEAEAGFKTFLGRNADSPLAGDAQYWLGETYYAQGDYKEAAQSFLKGYKNYPQNRKAPDSLLKLGMSLQKLGQKAQACGSYAQVTKDYPKATAVRNQALKEMQRAGC